MVRDDEKKVPFNKNRFFNETENCSIFSVVEKITKTNIDCIKSTLEYSFLITQTAKQKEINEIT